VQVLPVVVLQSKRRRKQRMKVRSKRTKRLRGLYEKVLREFPSDWTGCL